MRYLFLLIALPLWAQTKQIAITIDDLPCAGGCRGITEMQSITGRITGALKGTAATGFVNEIGVQAQGERDDRARLLERWLDAGLDLGNHTYSHPSPNQVPLQEYTDDIVKGEVVTKHLLGRRGKSMRYFRHPFTHTGPTAEYKQGIEKFLAERGYEIAPVTVENSDYVWALVHRRAWERGDAETANRVAREYVEHLGTALDAAERISVRVFGREIPQVLLLHANLLNAAVMPEILQQIAKRGYSVVSLETALKDAAYRTPDRYVSRFGPSWFERWGVSLGIPKPSRDEPNLPGWIEKAYNGLSPH
jgi:peptidoglycan/xylan/chitin deacetylase (PgdA/CDA1 family)